MSRLVLVGLLLGAGCMTPTGSGTITRATFTFPPVIDTSPTGWSVIETDDFTLRSDLPLAQMQEAAQLVAQSLIGLRAMFGKAPIAARHHVTVYALADGLEFERRFGRRVGGFAYSRGDETLLMLYGPPERWFVRAEAVWDGKDSVLQHELAHAVLNDYFPQQAQWFAEGMAQYLETFRWLDASTVRFGDASLSAYRNYRSIRSLSVEQMEKWTKYDQRGLEIWGYYGLSWAFVHWALNTKAREFGTYMSELAQHGPDVAWRATFAPLQGLDQEIYRYMTVGTYRVRVVKVPEATRLPATIRPLTQLEFDAVHRLFDELSAEMAKSH
jgi:Protein of unknown function (DUF1570)